MDQSKTVEVSIGSCNFHHSFRMISFNTVLSRNSDGFLMSGASNEAGVGKQAIF